jgi:hypothetical protein
MIEKAQTKAKIAKSNDDSDEEFENLSTISCVFI